MRRGAVHRMLAAAGWGLVVPSTVVAANRLVRHQRRGSVLMIEAVGPAWALPTLGALGLAALLRRRALAAVAGGLVGLHLAWLAPELRPGPSPPVSSDDPRLRLFSANLLFINRDMEGIAAEIRAADPDVVVLQELSRPNLDGLERAGIIDEYEHRWLDPRTDALGCGLLSRLPLDDPRQVRLAGLLMAVTTVVVGGHRVRLYNVHTRAPFGPGAAAQWEDQLDELGAIARAEPGPLVLAGDFNASSGHRAFRRLLSTGLRDAHVACGRWWATTWPCDMAPLPSVSRIDHVLVSPHLAVTAVAEGEGRGSDHRPVIADLTLAVRSRPDPGPARGRGAPVRR